MTVVVQGESSPQERINTVNESAARFVIETVFEEYGAVRVFELVDRLTGRIVRRSQTRSVLDGQRRHYNARHDNGLDPYTVV